MSNSNGIIESQRIYQIISSNEVFVSKLTEEDLQTLLDIFVSINDLNALLTNYVTSTDLTDSLLNYVKISDNNIITLESNNW
jgi:hypothetical protein